MDSLFSSPTLQSLFDTMATLSENADEIIARPENHPFSFDILANDIRTTLNPVAGFNVENFVSNRRLAGGWTAYRDNALTMGALIVEDHGEVKVLAIADRKKDLQIVVQRNPDGYGDRLCAKKLCDAKLLAVFDLK